MIEVSPKTKKMVQKLLDNGEDTSLATLDVAMESSEQLDAIKNLLQEEFNKPWSVTLKLE